MAKTTKKPVSGTVNKVRKPRARKTTASATTEKVAEKLDEVAKKVKTEVEEEVAKVLEDTFEAPVNKDSQGFEIVRNIVIITIILVVGGVALWMI